MLSCNEKKILKFICIIILLAAVTLTASCSSSGAKDPKVIHYSSMWKEGEPQAEWLKSTVAAFEKKTGIRVDLKLEGREVLTKEKGNIIMKTPPDIIEQEANELTAAYLDKEILAEPLDDLYNSKGPEGQEKLGDVLPLKIIDLYKKGGKNYFLPYEFITVLFICDGNLMDRNNIKIAETWEEFIASGEKLKEKGIAPLALDGNIYAYNANYYWLALERIMGPGSLLKAARDKSGAAFDAPGYLQAARYVAELSKAQRGFFQKGYENSNYPRAQAYWAKGKAGSILCGTWIPTETVMLVNKNFKYNFYAFPSVKGGLGRATDIPGLLIGSLIPRGAKNPEGARKLLKFMISRENAAKFAEDTLSISSRVDVPYPKMLEGVKAIVDKSTNFLKSYDGLMADAPEWFANIFLPLDNELAHGQISPEDFIKQMKKKSIDYHKDND